MVFAAFSNTKQNVSIILLYISMEIYKQGEVPIYPQSRDDVDDKNKPKDLKQVKCGQWLQRTNSRFTMLVSERYLGSWMC